VQVTPPRARDAFVPGGAPFWRQLLAREDLIEVEGVITDVHPGGMFTVKLDQGPAIQARVGGKMRQHFIRIVLGDRVKVGVSPYDPTHGIITYRSK
jgi:translation initiation factor IF-1